MTCFESDNEMCFAHSFLKYLWYIKEEAGNRQLGICIWHEGKTQIVLINLDLWDNYIDSNYDLLSELSHLSHFNIVTHL